LSKSTTLTEYDSAYLFQFVWPLKRKGKNTIIL
jgi:hypothetical protein